MRSTWMTYVAGVPSRSRSALPADWAHLHQLPASDGYPRFLWGEPCPMWVPPQSSSVAGAAKALVTSALDVTTVEVCLQIVITSTIKNSSLTPYPHLPPKGDQSSGRGLPRGSAVQQCFVGCGKSHAIIVILPNPTPKSKLQI
jgi:hypothetical protein